MRRVTIAITAAVMLLGTASMASAGTVTLHPSGFGEHSYAAWKSQEGLEDSHGTKDQYLYLQKHTSTVTFAAGVAVFRGVEGMSTADLDPLGFRYEVGGHCGAGAPRFNLRYEDMAGMRHTFFIGCAGMIPGGTIADDEDDLWERRTFAGTLPPGEVVSLSIVFDEGDDVGEGSVRLDDIQVGPYLWTSASDNGQNNVVSAAEAQTILTEPFAIALRR